MNPTPDLSSHNFGVAMRRARKLKGLSQRELATLAKINTETVNRIENGDENTRTKTIEKIKRALPDLDIAYYPGSFVATTTVPMAQDKDRLAELQNRVVHMVQAITSIDRLQKLQAMALRALTEDLDPTPTRKVSRRKR